MIEYLSVFLFGAMIGSFLNVCIHRMPLDESVVWPRSHCPRCKKKIRGYDNIPLLSYLILGGKCRACKKPISLRYFLVELITPLLFVALLRKFGLTLEFFIFMVLGTGLIIATFVDIKHRIIPDEVSVGGMIAGFILSSVRGVEAAPLVFHFSPMVTSLLGILIGGGVIYLTGVCFDFVYFKLLKKPPIGGETESMGGGDIKLLAMIGAFLGWKGALLTFLIAPFFGSIIGVFNLVIKKDHTIPYGPFLSLGALVALFWGEKIIQVLYRYPL
jgi:leader peptidase (prepilin peptidase) / N-methyltransferase